VPADDASRIEALEAEVRRLHVMLESAPDFIARITLDGKFLYPNHVAPGSDTAGAIGTGFEKYIPEAFHDRAHAALTAAHRTRSVQQFATIGLVAAGKMG